MKRPPETRSRVLLVDKPAQWTSFQVVRRVRPMLGRKVGHAGTLDPFATGLLVVLAGQATRISELIMEMPKTYEVTAQFGFVSSTQDPTGEISPTRREVEEQALRRALGSFQGRITQVVPLTSAVKVDGEPLYRRAHRGEVCDTPTREVVVHDLRLVHFDPEQQTGRLIVRASKGTYVRTLVHDLGDVLGAGAYAAALRRLSIGHMRVEEAVSPDEVEQALAWADDGEDAAEVRKAVVTISEVLRTLPRYDVRDVDERRVRNGNELLGMPPGVFRVYGSEGLLAIYEGIGGVSRPRVVFSSPQE